MNLKLENSISEIADKARDRYDDALESVREGTEKVAGRVSKGKKPIRTISRYGVKLSGVSHRTANKLWKRQTKLVEDQIDAVADHLKAAAKAEDLKDLVKTQIDLIPGNTSRLADEAREAFEIVKEAGGEIRVLVKETIDELRGKKKPAVRKSTAATANRPAPVATPTSVDQEAA
ncbi:MAG: phasin family protein [Woeseiaceae bacterium]